MMNKKLGRFKQWAGEVMGGAEKTTVSDEIRDLELEMDLRSDGMDRLQRSMTTYVKSISRRDDCEEGAKLLPIAYLGTAMIHHGEEFRDDSEYGRRLIQIGRAQQQIGMVQERYTNRSIDSWGDSLGRSVAQMKEYQAARKKLDQRRLAYDASLAKVHKTKHDDFRAEEELRAQKAKFEESSEDVIRRMQDIREAEAASIVALSEFLDAEMEYHTQSREALARIRAEWPAVTIGPDIGQSYQPRMPPARSRSNTIRSQASDRSEPVQVMGEALRSTPSFRRTSPIRAESSGPAPRIIRTGSFMHPANASATASGQSSRSQTPKPQIGTLVRSFTDLSVASDPRRHGQPVQDQSRDSEAESPEWAAPSASSIGPGYRLGGGPSGRYDSPVTPMSLASSPASTSHLSAAITGSSSGAIGGGGGGKGMPPPPPPSRLKKAAPPPPPPKKSPAVMAAAGRGFP